MCSADIFKLYRKATSLFSKARLISRLVLPGPVEVDDFMIGMNDQDSSLKKRWVLQLYDRTLNAPLLFFLRSDHDYRNIPAYLQKHIEHTRYPAAVFTDNKPSYVFESLKKNRRISRLNCRGFLHFFKQVEEQQCHKAFPFVSLQNVKNTWPAIKYAFPYALHFSMKPGNTSTASRSSDSLKRSASLTSFLSPSAHYFIAYFQEFKKLETSRTRRSCPRSSTSIRWSSPSTTRSASSGAPRRFHSYATLLGTSTPL